MMIPRKITRLIAPFGYQEISGLTQQLNRGRSEFLSKQELLQVKLCLQHTFDNHPRDINPDLVVIQRQVEKALAQQA